MQRLEDEVGTPLFIRDNRSVSITNAGIEYRHFAEQILDSWSKLKSNISPKQDLLYGQLNLYCSVTAAYSHLPALLDRFRREHPHVEIHLTTGDAANAMSEVKSNRVDIAIAALPESLPDQLNFTKIDDIPLVIIAPTYRCQVQQLLTESYIPWDRLPFIVPEHGPGRLRTDTWFKQLGLLPNIYAQVSGQEAIASMVALGCGVGITPKVVINNSPVKDRIQVIASPIDIAPFELGCCCKQNRIDDPLIAAFFNII